MNEIKISEKALEALVNLTKINQRYSHKYYCDAENIQNSYLSEIKPILEPYKNQSSTILREMEKRETIYKEQVDCRINIK
ncbi:MAG: hypothetical protein Q7R52_04045 [archaeon]|nr:hypothetical protein [archaeon]